MHEGAVRLVLHLAASRLVLSKGRTDKRTDTGAQQARRRGKGLRGRPPTHPASHARIQVLPRICCISKPTSPITELAQACTRGRCACLGGDGRRRRAARQPRLGAALQLPRGTRQQAMLRRACGRERGRGGGGGGVAHRQAEWGAALACAPLASARLPGWLAAHRQQLSTPHPQPWPSTHRLRTPTATASSASRAAQHSRVGLGSPYT